MKIFNTSTIPQLDLYTIKHEPISSVDLMERAASSMAFEIMARFRRSVPVVVFAGPGNNGGDALAVARMLREEGYRVEVFLFNPKQKLSADCEKNRDRLAEMGEVDVTEVVSEFIPPSLHKNTLVIDGLFGTGLKSSLSGGYASVVQYINSSEATVVSLDVPSGLFCEDNRENTPRNIIQADLTITCQFPKLAFVLPENEKFVGEWVIIDIALHPEILDKTESRIHYTVAQNAVALLKKRDCFVGKYDVGSVLLIAGSYGMMGAAVMATESALRGGAGLVSVHIPRCGYSILQQAVPEAVVSIDADEYCFTGIEIEHRYNALAIGPGLGQSDATQNALKALILQMKRPLVIDADGLNNLAAHPDDLLSLLPPNSIITPHTGEFDRLFGRSDTAYERLSKAQDAARRYRIIVILKGAYTAIVTPQGNMHFNSTGNSGMATAGSGDVLTGLLAALLAQGYHPNEAAILGVFLHGLAGDIALETGSVESLTARDITAHLGKAFRQLRKLQTDL